MRMWWSATLTREATGVRSSVREAFLSSRERSSRWEVLCVCIFQPCMCVCRHAECLFLSVSDLCWKMCVTVPQITSPESLEHQFLMIWYSMLETILIKSQCYMLYIPGRGVECEISTFKYSFFPFFCPSLAHILPSRSSSNSPLQSSWWLCQMAPQSTSPTVWVRRSTPSSTLMGVFASETLRSSKPPSLDWNSVFLFQSVRHIAPAFKFLSKCGIRGALHAYHIMYYARI